MHENIAPSSICQIVAIYSSELGCFVQFRGKLKTFSQRYTIGVQRPLGTLNLSTEN